MLLAALVMQASIPVGYMPAAPGSGLLFELCPAGMPAGFSRSMGHAHHHVESADEGGQVDEDSCPIGHLLSAVVAVDSFWLLDTLAALPIHILEPVPPALSRAAAQHRSRGPPA